LSIKIGQRDVPIFFFIGEKDYNTSKNGSGKGGLLREQKKQ